MGKNDAHPHHKRQQQGCQDVTQGRDLQIKIRLEILCRHGGRRQFAGIQVEGEGIRSADVGEKARADGTQVGDAQHHQEHLPRSLAHMGDGRGHKAQHHERNDELEHLGEQDVERLEHPHQRLRSHHPQQSAEGDGYDNL